jgi:uncharacterized membrane protein (UPF0127 family)
LILQAAGRACSAASPLDDGSALSIAPCHAIHTFFMRFAIDALFVSRDGRVLKVRGDVGPRRIAAAWRAFAVVELRAGAIERSGTRKGGPNSKSVAL